MAKTLNYKHQQELTSFDLSKRITTSRFFSKVDLTPSAKLTFRGLLDFRNHKTGLTFPKQSTIADATGLTKASVNRAIEELRKAKLIITVKYNGRLHYQFTNVFYNLLQEPDEIIVAEDIKTETCNNKVYNEANNNSIPRIITNKTKQIKKQTSFENKGLRGVNPVKPILEQYQLDKQNAVSPFDDRDCAISILKTILKPETQRHAFARKMFQKLQSIWQFDEKTLEQIKAGGNKND